jgi:hypothetical protein
MFVYRSYAAGGSMMQVGVVLLGFITAAMHGQTAGSLAAAKAACGAGDPKYSVKTIPSKVVSGVDEGKAQLYLLEVQDHVAFCPLGCGEIVKLGLDGEWAGATKGNSYLVLPVASGEHHLCAEWDSRAWRLHKHLELAAFRAEATKSYYFRVHITPGTTETIETYRFEPVNEDEGKLLVASLSRSIWTNQ